MLIYKRSFSRTCRITIRSLLEFQWQTSQCWKPESTLLPFDVEKGKSTVINYMDQSIIILIFEISACSSTGYKTVIILPWLWFGPSMSLQQPDGSLSPSPSHEPGLCPHASLPCLRSAASGPHRVSPWVPDPCCIHRFTPGQVSHCCFRHGRGVCLFPRADAPPNPPPRISLLFSFHCLIVGSLPRLGCTSQNWHPLLFFPLAGAPGVNRCISPLGSGGIFFLINLQVPHCLVSMWRLFNSNVLKKKKIALPSDWFSKLNIDVGNKNFQDRTLLAAKVYWEQNGMYLILSRCKMIILQPNGMFFSVCAFYKTLYLLGKFRMIFG
jgi:hypothetical protein